MHSLENTVMARTQQPPSVQQTLTLKDFAARMGVTPRKVMDIGRKQGFPMPLNPGDRIPHLRFAAQPCEEFFRGTFKGERYFLPEAAQPKAPVRPVNEAHAAVAEAELAATPASARESGAGALLDILLPRGDGPTTEITIRRRSDGVIEYIQKPRK